MSEGPLTYPVSAVCDGSGTATIKIQFGSFAPPNAWVKVNIILDVLGSPSCQLIADSVVLDQAGGPQPQLGPGVFTGSQNVSIVVSGAQPNSTVVAHVNGLWSDNLADLDSVATLSGGTIGAQQIVGTPFLEASGQAIAPSGTYTSSIYPMLGYTGVLVQYITTLGALTAMPTVQLQWLDGATPPNVIFQSNWQAQKIIDNVQAWGQNMRVVVTNNDAAHTCNISLTLVPISQLPPQKADSLTYKATSLNEILGIHNQSCAKGATLTAVTAAGLGWSGPATLYVNPNANSYFSGTTEPQPNYAFKLSYAPAFDGSNNAIGTEKILVNYPYFCPIAVEQIDLVDQPLKMTFTNNGLLNATVTPDLSVMAGYR